MEHPIFACSMAVFCVNKVGRHGGNPHAFSPKKTKHKGGRCRNTTKSITLPCGRIIRQRDNTFGRGRPIWGKSNLAQGKRSQSGVSPWVYGFPPIIATYRGKGKHWASQGVTWHTIPRVPFTSHLLGSFALGQAPHAPLGVSQANHVSMRNLNMEQPEKGQTASNCHQQSKCFYITK